MRELVAFRSVPGTIVATRQDIDVPPIRVETVEHQRIEKRCPCDTVNTGAFPTGVKCAVSYGPRLHAVGAYLLNVHYLPVGRAAAVFKDLFHVPVSTGWVSSLGQKTSALLADTVTLIKQAVTASPVAHVDETGLRVAVGHEDLRTVQYYLQADLVLKVRVLARITPPDIGQISTAQFPPDLGLPHRPVIMQNSCGGTGARSPPRSAFQAPRLSPFRMIPDSA